MAAVPLTSGNTLAYVNNNSTHLRDPSFSAYLNERDETFVLKPSATITTTPTPQEPIYQMSLGRKKNGYGEISVFGAEKYFNGVMDVEEASAIVNKTEKKHQPKKDVRVDKPEIHDMKPKTKRGTGTPSTCSEASWNSRSALLPIVQNRQDKGNGKNFFAALGCKCYCSDDTSVDVNENVSDIKSSIKKHDDSHGKVMAILPIKEEFPSKKLDKGANGIDSEDCFALPISNSALGTLSSEEKARKSLEVFGSPVMDKEDIALSLEKRLSMLTWEANPRVDQKSPTISVVASGPSTDDIDSDSSSDLFEIKSLSSNGHPFFRRQESDDMSSCVSPSTCYEPSEASIDWSVVTASAANFSVTSGYDEPRPISNAKNNEKVKAKSSSKDTAKRRPSMLLGCRSQKAVKVIGEAHKLPEKKPEFRGHQKSNSSFTPRSRFQAESKVTDLESAHAQRAFAKPTLSQLHPAHAADSVYMH